MQHPAIDMSVIVPAYNEEQRLGKTLKQMMSGLRRSFDRFEIIVVDDGSRDGTASLVEAYAARYSEIRLIRYEQNRGKGYAVRRGVMASSGRYVLFSDADLSTPIRDVHKLLNVLGDHEIAIGSRAIRDSRVVQYQPFYRVLMGKTFNKIVQLLAMPGIKDTQCGFKCFNGEVARQIFSCCRIDGFSFDVEVLYVARRLGCRIKEVGVTWRNSPDSRVHPVWHSLQMFRDLMIIRFNGWCGYYFPKGALRFNTDA